MLIDPGPALTDLPPLSGAADAAAGRRPIRSFVLRQGRLTAAQARALQSHWPRFGVDWAPGQRLDPATLFGDRRAPVVPVILEIGFGNGEALLDMAAAAPDRGFLGCEVHGPGVGHLLLELARREIDNVRVLRADATALLADGLPPASLAAVHLFFPDPWPKARHHKRRIVQPAFLDGLARVLAPGGRFHAATDWAPYAVHIRDLCEADRARFTNAAGPGAFSPRPPERPPTRFERRGERLGHAVFDLIYLRN